MRKKANKERLPLLFAALLGALLLSNCGYRPEGVEAVQPLSDVPAAAAALPEETAAPQGKTYTVTYRVNGAETTELVAEGGSVQNAPEFMASENCAIVAWKNANGTKVDIRTAPVYADAVYEAVPGPALRREGAYIAAGNDGLFHPLDKFTRSDAARAVYALLDTKPTGETFLKDVTTHAKCYTAATTLVTAGYMTLNDGRFYPDVAITRADLAALLAEMKRVVKPGGLIILSEMYNDGQPKASLTHWILHDIDCTMHTIDGIYHHPTYSKSEILWLARNAGLTVEKTLCDLIDDPKVVAKLRERIAAVPENLKKYESNPAHAFLAAEAAWLNEEYEANGVTSAEQLVVFCRK